MVATPQDILSIEKTGEFDGIYHVLGGLISPLDGVHPEMLRLKELSSKLQNSGVNEIILAINPTVEGDATILYMTKFLHSYQVKLSKLAYGLPMGSDIDYIDELTLKKAIQGRTNLESASKC